MVSAVSRSSSTTKKKKTSSASNPANRDKSGATGTIRTSGGKVTSVSGSFAKSNVVGQRRSVADLGIESARRGFKKGLGLRGTGADADLQRTQASERANKGATGEVGFLTGEDFKPQGQKDREALKSALPGLVEES